MKKPVIGIMANVLIVESGPFPGLERAYVNNQYVEAITLAGGVPVLLPVIEDPEAIEEQLTRVDGLLFSGGYDLDPLQYGEEPCHELGYIFPEVDAHQLMAIRIAEKLQKPVLGICRGMQVINVAFGGTLYQDVAQFSRDRLKHSQQAKMYVPTHTVDITENTTLQEIFGQNSIITNSFHHQSVKDIAPGFQVNAVAKDGVIEGMEKIQGAFMVAVQWHPEMMAAKYESMLRLFKALVKAAEESVGVK